MGGGVACDGSNYLAAIQGDASDHASATAQLLSPSGRPIGGRITTGRTGGTPDVAFDGSNYLMVWPDDMAGEVSNRIYGMFITPTGASMAAPFPIGPTYGVVDFNSMRPLAFDGSRYFVIWQDSTLGEANSDIYGRFVTPAGGFPGGAIPVCTSAGPQQSPSVAAGRTNSLLVWMNRASAVPESWDIGGRFVDGSGGLSGIFRVNQTNSPCPDLVNAAFDGTNYLVVWSTDLGPGGTNAPVWDVRGRLVTPDGGFIGPEFPIVTDAGDQIYPAATFDGLNCLVQWTEKPQAGDATIRARFLSPAGQPVGQAFTVFTSQSGMPPLIARAHFDGHRFLSVATMGSEFEALDIDIYGAFIPRSGMGGPGFPVRTNALAGSMTIGAAFDGTNYLVGIQGDSVSRNHICAQMVDRNGGPVGPNISVGGTGGVPYVAFDGANYLVVWPDDTKSSEEHNDDDILGRLVSRAGAPIGSVIPICTAPEMQGFDQVNSLVFDGLNYLTAWTDARNGDDDANIYARLISPAGVLTGSEIAVCTQPGKQMGAALANGRTNCLVVWQNRVLNVDPYPKWQVEGRFVGRSGEMGPIFRINQTNSVIDNLMGVAFDGANFLVIWDADSGPGGDDAEGIWDIHGRFVAQDGSFPGSEFPVTMAPGDQHFGTVRFDGINYLVSWHDSLDMNTKFRFFSPAGQAVGEAFHVFSPDGIRFPMAVLALFDGRRFMALANLMDGLDFATVEDLYGAFILGSANAARLDLPRGPTLLTVTGVPGQNYAVQATTNLSGAGSWTAIMTNNAGSGTFTCSDTNAASHRRRFYRTLKVP